MSSKKSKLETGAPQGFWENFVLNLINFPYLFTIERLEFSVLLSILQTKMFNFL